jgi:hypothetical protein
MKKSELEKISDGLNLVADGLRDLAKKECGCGKKESKAKEPIIDEEPTKEASTDGEATGGAALPKEPQVHEVTIEDVRAVMADKSQDGKTQQVKALLKKYDAERLSGVQPERLKALLAEVKKL